MIHLNSTFIVFAIVAAAVSATAGIVALVRESRRRTAQLFQDDVAVRIDFAGRTIDDPTLHTQRYQEA